MSYWKYRFRRERSERVSERCDQLCISLEDARTGRSIRKQDFLKERRMRFDESSERQQHKLFNPSRTRRPFSINRIEERTSGSSRAPTAARVPAEPPSWRARRARRRKKTQTSANFPRSTAPTIRGGTEIIYNRRSLATRDFGDGANGAHEALGESSSVKITSRRVHAS